MLLYRLLISVLWIPAALGLLLQVLRGRERFADWLERLGFRMGAAPGPHIWLHAASNGELASARPVVLALRAARPDLGLVITTNSTSGRTLAQKWNIDGVSAQLAPLDTIWAAKRMLRRFAVTGLIIVESEFWLNRIVASSGSGAPVFVMGARLSRRTTRQWARRRWLWQALHSHLTHLSPQDHNSRQRLLALGVAPERIGPVLDLKALYDPPKDLTPDATLCAVFPRADTWLAASTHAGEDEIVLEAHQALKSVWPELQLIITPRHPKRGDAIATMIRQSGSGLTRRSTGDTPRMGSVYLADTLGEMPLWYQLAGTTFVGGSLVEKGGHTPFEPATFSSALLHGPDVGNFTAIYRRLDVAGAAIQVSDAETLRNAVLQLRDPERREAMRRTANRVMVQTADFKTEIERFVDAMPAQAPASLDL